MFKWFKDWTRKRDRRLCESLGHKEGWYPAPPWVCERCLQDYKEEWELANKDWEKKN